MALEIERKFLVCGPFKHLATSCSEIKQGYLNSSKDRTVRIRIRDGKGYLTIKGRSSGISRFEWEKEIPLQEAEALFLLTEPGRIEKRRYLVPCADGTHTWEVDEFLGDNAGLILAEVELAPGEQDAELPKPSWISDEVSSDPRYYNSYLGAHPFKDW